MYKNFQEAYYSIVKDIYECGNNVTVRGLEMREKIPVYFEIENPRDRLLNISCRKNIKKYIFGELLWYLSGRNDEHKEEHIYIIDFTDNVNKILYEIKPDRLKMNIKNLLKSILRCGKDYQTMVFIIILLMGILYLMGCLL